MRFSSRTKPEVKDSQSFPAHLESEGVVESFSIVEFSALEHLLEERGPQSSESVELWNVAEQFYLAATAQNLKRLVRHLAQKQSPALTPNRIPASKISRTIDQIFQQTHLFLGNPPPRGAHLICWHKRKYNI
jgi:hypothetical protein